MSTNPLLIKLSSMGDVVHSFPALSEAAGHGHRFDWVVEESFVPLARQHPAVDQVIPFALRRWRREGLSGIRQFWRFRQELRSRGHDFVLDAQGLAKSMIVARLSGAPKRVGFAHDSAREPWVSRFYSRGISVERELHAIDRLRLLFGQALRYEVDLSRNVAVDVSRDRDAAGAGAIVVVHGTTWMSKEFPEPIWREVIAELSRAGHRLEVLSGSASELARAQRLCDGAPGALAIEPGTLAGAFDRIKAARLVVGVDSGLTHLAALLGVPTIGLYGATSAVRTGARGPHTQNLVSDFACSPCLQRRCLYQGSPMQHAGIAVEPACYAELSSARIVTAVSHLLSEVPRQ